MSISITDFQDNGSVVSFKVKGVNNTFINALRRYSMMHVPVLAIDKVIFYENTSPMFDEYIAHRIGLIPIKTPDKTPDVVELEFTLDELGPKLVMSGDLRGAKGVEVAISDIPIITLMKDQVLRLEGIAKTGVGKKHAKFQTGLASYGQISEDEFKFFFETFFQKEPKQVLLEALDILSSDLAGLEAQLLEKKTSSKTTKKSAKKTTAKKSAKKTTAKKTTKKTSTTKKSTKKAATKSKKTTSKGASKSKKTTKKKKKA